MEKSKEQSLESKDKINLEDYLKSLDFSKIDIPLKKHFVSTEKWLRRGQVFPHEDTEDMDIDKVELSFMEFFNRVKELKIDSSSIQRQLKVDLTKIPHKSNQILKLYGKVLRKDNLWSYDMNLLFLWAVLKTASLCEKSVAEMNDADWDIIAEAFFCSDREDLKFQWQYLQKSVAKKAPWTEEEDKILADLLKDGEPKNKKWKYIAKHLYERSSRKVPRLGRHCHERWTYHLDPNLKKKCPWSQEEDDIIVECVQKYGKRWSLISKKLTGRNENSVKIRFKRLQNMYSINIPNSEKRHALPLKKLPYPGLKNEDLSENEDSMSELSEEQGKCSIPDPFREKIGLNQSNSILDKNPCGTGYPSIWSNIRTLPNSENGLLEVQNLGFDKVKVENYNEAYQIKLEENEKGKPLNTHAVNNPMEDLLYQPNYLQEGGWFYKYPNLIMTNMVQLQNQQENPCCCFNGFPNSCGNHSFYGVSNPHILRNNIYGRVPFGLNSNYGGILPMGARIIIPSVEDCQRTKFVQYLSNMKHHQQQGVAYPAENFLNYINPMTNPNQF